MSGLFHPHDVSRSDFCKNLCVADDLPQHVAGVGRAPVGQGEGVALGPEAHRAGLDHRARVGLELARFNADLHPPSAALQGVLPSSRPSMLEPLIRPLNSPLRPASLKLRRSPRRRTSSSGMSRPSRRALPETRVSCCLSESVAGARLTAGGMAACHFPCTFAGTMYR